MSMGMEYQSMSKTPETDAEMCDGWSGAAFAVSVEFARKLEQQRDALKAALEQAIEQLEADYVATPLDGNRALIDKLRATLAEVK